MRFINENDIALILCGEHGLKQGELNCLDNAVDLLSDTIDECGPNDQDVLAYCTRWLELIEARVERSLKLKQSGKRVCQ